MVECLEMLNQQYKTGKVIEQKVWKIQMRKNPKQSIKMLNQQYKKSQEKMSSIVESTI